jgi:hypothetical protein
MLEIGHTVLKKNFTEREYDCRLQPTLDKSPSPRFKPGRGWRRQKRSLSASCMTRASRAPAILPNKLLPKRVLRNPSKFV